MQAVLLLHGTRLTETHVKSFYKSIKVGEEVTDSKVSMYLSCSYVYTFMTYISVHIQYIILMPDLNKFVSMVLH